MAWSGSAAPRATPAPAAPACKELWARERGLGVDALQPGHLRAHVHGEALSPKGPKALAEKQGGDQLVVSPSPEAAIWGQGWDCERVLRAGTHTLLQGTGPGRLEAQEWAATWIWPLE